MQDWDSSPAPPTPCHCLSREDQVDSSSATRPGDVQRSEGVSCVVMDGQLKRWAVSCMCMLQRGQIGEGCAVGLI